MVSHGGEHDRGAAVFVLAVGRSTLKENKCSGNSSGEFRYKRYQSRPKKACVNGYGIISLNLGTQCEAALSKSATPPLQTAFQGCQKSR